MGDIRVKINLDGMTLGDYANLQRGKIVGLLGKCVSVQGYARMQDVPIGALKQISDALLADLSKVTVGDMISPIPADAIHIVNMDTMLIGDLEAIESGMGLIDVFRKFVLVDGYEMDAIPFKAIGLIRDKLSDAIGEAADPNA